jgi:hypothetical protein
VARADQPEVATLKQREADRYRKAADDALQQLDWAIGYLHGIRKVQIARCRAGLAGTEPCSAGEDYLDRARASCTRHSRSGVL